jgi:hypothetical protein
VARATCDSYKLAKNDEILLSLVSQRFLYMRNIKFCGISSPADSSLCNLLSYNCHAEIAPVLLFTLCAEPLSIEIKRKLESEEELLPWTKKQKSANLEGAGVDKNSNFL